MSGSTGVEFLEAARICFRKYTTFQGRAPRSEFWWWVLFQVLANGALNRILITIVELTIPRASMTGPFGEPVLKPMYTLACAMTGLIFLLPSIAVTVRRLHDRNKSGWCCLLGAAPFFIIMLAGFWTGLNRPPVPWAASVNEIILIVLLALGLLLFIGWIRFLIAIFSRGTAGDNRFGPDPLQDVWAPGQ